jgi:hypothetical protein
MTVGITESRTESNCGGNEFFNSLLEPIDQPVVIADYGSSQGLNSLAPMRLAIESVCQRSSAI